MPTLKFVPRTPIARDEDGSINEARTTANFAQLLASTVAGAVAPVADEVDAEETAIIASAVSDLFDTYRGMAITMPTVANRVATALNATPTNHPVLVKRTLAYLRANVGEGGEFTVKKGPNGGVSRTADLPVEAPEAPASEPAVEA
jgi:hypothetical protein